MWPEAMPAEVVEVNFMPPKWPLPFSMSAKQSPETFCSLRVLPRTLRSDGRRFRERQWNGAAEGGGGRARQCGAGAAPPHLVQRAHRPQRLDGREIPDLAALEVEDGDGRAGVEHGRGEEDLEDPGRAEEERAIDGVGPLHDGHHGGAGAVAQRLPVRCGQAERLGRLHLLRLAGALGYCHARLKRRCTPV